MNNVIVRHIAAVSLLVAGSTLLASCSKTVREGRSPAYLIIDRITATSGAEPDDESDELSSDVATEGSVFEDLGEATFRLALRDVGSIGASAEPTTNNFITVNRYRVSYRRTDGRATPGVDVPYAFEGAGTVTVGANAAALNFLLVRAQAKLEPPLRNLRGGGGTMALSTIADITFYGRDQTGNDVTVTGSISINFADWADPS